MDFCYLVQCNLFDESTLNAINVAVTKFHAYHIIFEDVGICNHFSLPCQHSVKHFWLLIQMFGAPNGLCSSITELKHIKAVKEPYWHSCHFEALSQMLLTNQRIDKLAACHINLTTCNMLDGPCLAPGVDPIIPMVELAPDVDPIIPMPPLPPFGRHDPDDDAVDRPRAIASVLLAKTRGKSSFLLVYIINIMSVFFCSQQIPLESTWTCTPNKPARSPKPYTQISIQPTSSW